MKTTLPSNQSFGWTFTGVFVLLGALLNPWAMLAAAAMAVVTLTRQQWLTPLNHAWMKFGEAIARVMNPIILGLIFFGLFTPVAIVMRLAGRDVLTRKWEAARRSYWVPRDPPGPPDDSFRNMF